jgi:fructokinase
VRFGLIREVTGIGEVLVDFVATEPVSYSEAFTFQKCFGGAPMNTLVGVARLGASAGAIAAVGDDPFGQFLIKELEKNQIDVSHVKIMKGIRTTISFVANEPRTGERTFTFYREPWIQTADSELSIEESDLDYVSNTKILHVSGFALSQNPSRQAVLTAVKHAKKTGVKISFDPTLRVDVWRSEGTLRRLYKQMLELSDIATFSREEAMFIFGTNDPEKVARYALGYGIMVAGIKLGKDGAFLATREGKKLYSPAFKVKAVDTTGAGDAWNAGLLIGLLKDLDLRTCVAMANAVGAIKVTKRGAITALPDRNELNRFLREHNANLQI